MPNEKFTQLPSVPNATLNDIICAVQSGSSVQETLSQVGALFLANTILSFAGNPNGNLAGSTFQICWDTLDEILYICTMTGTSTTAVWTQAGLNGIATPTQGGTGVSNPAAHTIPIAEGSSDFNFLPLTNGELLIGSTGLDPVPATLTAGTNITITNGSGTIQISTSGAGSFTWHEITGTNQTMSPNSGYIANNAGTVTLTLPPTSIEGDIIEVVGKGAGGWSIAQNAGQIIHFGTSDTTSGTGGSLSSTHQYDGISLLCTAANTDWTVNVGAQGNITVV